MINKNMKITTFLIVCFISLTTGINSQEQKDDYVNVLTDENFKDFISQNDYVLVKFYAPWCGHCKSMAPDYKSAAEELKDTPYKLAKLDATEHKQAAQDAGVSGYPTLIFYIKGQAKPYTGERTKDGIIEWINTKVAKYLDQQANHVEGEPQKDDDIYILTDDNFDNFISKNDFVFVKFYAPWCGHCKKMAPALSKTASDLAESNPEIKIAKVDATVEKEVAGKIGLRGYPTIKFYYKQQMVDYTGEREAEAMTNWLIKKSSNPVSLIETIEDLENLKKEEEVVVVLFGKTDLDIFTTFAVSYDYAKFAYVTNSTIRDKYKVKENAVVLFKKFDEKRNDIPGVYSLPTIETFVKKNSIPSYMEKHEKNDRFLAGGSPSIFIFYDHDNESTRDTYEDVTIDLASRLKGRGILIYTSDVKNAHQKKFSENLGVRAEMLPIVLLLDSNNDKYVMTSKRINSNTIRKFISEWQSGNAKPFIKSAPVPEFQGVVTEVVGKTYNDIVKNSDKDVLLEIYAPWCGHCKKLAPVYEELGNTLKHNDKLVIAKFDGSANEAKGLTWKGFPTILFFPAGAKEPITYERSGTDTVDTFIQFIKKNAKYPITDGLELDEDFVDDDEVRDDL